MELLYITYTIRTNKRVLLIARDVLASLRGTFNCTIITTNFVINSVSGTSKLDTSNSTALLKKDYKDSSSNYYYSIEECIWWSIWNRYAVFSATSLWSLHNQYTFSYGKTQTGRDPIIGHHHTRNLKSIQHDYVILTNNNNCILCIIIIDTQLLSLDTTNHTEAMWSFEKYVVL